MNSFDKEDVLCRGYARNNEEWWFLVEHNWVNLSRIMQTYLSQDEQDAATMAKERKNSVALWKLLGTTYDRMPDRPWIHQVPGFGALCDLCSDFHKDD